MRHPYSSYHPKEALQRGEHPCQGEIPAAVFHRTIQQGHYVKDIRLHKDVALA